MMAALLIALASTLGPGTLDGSPAADASAVELRRHQGTWVVTSAIFDGQESDPEVAASIRRVVDGDHAVWRRDGQAFAGTRIELDPTAEPKTIDVLPDGGPNRGRRTPGIYRFEGDSLTICMAPPGGARPDAFEAQAGSGRSLMTFRRLTEAE